MTSSVGARPTYRVAVLLFTDADILDFAGPIEVLSHATHNRNREAPEPIFSIETISRRNDVPVSTGRSTLCVQPSMSLTQALEVLDEFHVLIVPGGPPEAVQGVIETDDKLELQIIKSFSKLVPAAEHGQGDRIMLSICTGALLLGAAGVLGGLKVTTHHQALDLLKKICAESSNSGTAEGETEVVGGQRFVDAGRVKDGLRIVTAGGISSGLDAALYLVELTKDVETADFIAKVMEYQRR